MNFQADGSVNREQRQEAQSVEKQRSGSFKVDTFKKSLRVLNQSSINLPNVKKQKVGQIKAANGSTLELLVQNDSSFLGSATFKNAMMNNNNDSSITPLGSSTMIDGEPSIQLKNDSVTIENSDVNIGRYGQNSMRNGGLSAFQRNSSTVEKPRATLQTGISSNVNEMQRRIMTNSTSLMDPLKQDQRSFSTILNQSTRNLPTKKVLAGAGDYASVNILPVIGSEVSIEQSSGANSQFKNINTKVELTRKDIQNYLVNGSISKEFIHSNKKELQKFIKNQTRSTSDFMRGYQTYEAKKGDYETVGKQDSQSTLIDSLISNKRLNGGNQSNLSITQKAIKLNNEGDHDGQNSGLALITPSLKRKLIGSATVHIDDQADSQEIAVNHSAAKRGGSQTFQKTERARQRSNNRQLHYQSNDVKLEHKFKGETSTVSSKVMETWINETLTDAYHLDIPGVLMHPGHKNPIHRYGIDRQTLVDAGISGKQVDRIYKSLFVYSVGFFELLKKILACSSKNFSIITSIWKVYQVLLEYCCKTDYRILIAEITDKHNQELDTMERLFKAKILNLQDDEKVLKQNMETMRNYNDSLEKERQMEKDLRLKLEGEYMQNNKNHEEEVKLRLKFEGKFNQMHDTHRELEIRHDRTLKELYASQQQLKEAEENASIKSQELIDVQKIKQQQETIIAELKDYKKVTEREVKKKNMNLQQAERQRSKINDDFELQRYQIQEGQKDLNEVKVQMEVQKQNIEHLNGIIAAQNLEKEEVELTRLEIKGQYDKIKVLYEARAGKIEMAEATLQSQQLMSQQYHTELETLRKRTSRLENTLVEHEQVHVEIVEQRKLLIADNKNYKKEIKLVHEQIKKMNNERHELMVQLTEMTDRSNELEKMKDKGLLDIKRLHDEIKKNDQSFITYKQEVLKRETEVNNARLALKNQVKELEQDIDYRKSQVEQLEAGLQKLQSAINDKDMKGSQLQNVIAENMNEIATLKQHLKQLNSTYDETRLQLRKTEANAANSDTAKDDAVIAMIQAEEASKTWQATVQALQRQVKEERARVNEMNLLVYQTSQTDNERNMMHAEEYISRYSAMYAELEAAREERTSNREKLDNYTNLMTSLVNVEHQRDQVRKEIDEANDQIDKLESKVTDFEAEVQRLKEKHEEDLKELKEGHNVEVNELEQKIQKERIELAGMKSSRMKEQRTDRMKIAELQKQIKSLGGTVDQSKLPNVAKKAGIQALFKASGSSFNTMVDAEVQTDPIKFESQRTRRPQKQQTKRIQMAHSSDQLQQVQENQESMEPSSISMPSNTDDRSKNKTLNSDSDSGAPRMIINQDSSSDDEEGSYITGSNKQIMKTLDDRSRDKSRDKSRGSKERSRDKLSLSHTSKSSMITGKTKKLSQKSEAKKAGDRKELFKKWLVNEERQILTKLEQVVDSNQVVNPNKVKLWREDMRIPAMFRNVADLKDEDLADVEKRIEAEVELFKMRALKKIEYGSEYSSDFEEIEESHYISTDGEGGKNSSLSPNREEANIQVLRGATLKQPKLATAQMTGTFGTAQGMREVNSTQMQSQQQDVDISLRGTATRGDENKQGTPFPEMVSPTNSNALDSHQYGIHTKTSPVGATSSDRDYDITNNRSSAADKLFEQMQLINKRRRERALSSGVDDDTGMKIYDGENVAQYIVVRNAEGKDVYKRRVVNKGRVKKERPEGYHDKKKQLLEAIAQKLSTIELDKKQTRKNAYANMFSNFAKNYEHTLDVLVKQSDDYIKNKAKNRRQIHKNEGVENLIKGRHNREWIIKQMKETSAWQLHLARLKEELKEQEDRWEHREEEKAEIERKREEIRQLEEQHERERSLERRQKITIVREDMQDRERTMISLAEQTFMSQHSNQDDDVDGPNMMITAMQEVSSPNPTTNLKIKVSSAEQMSERNSAAQQQVTNSVEADRKMHAEMADLSVWSEDALNAALSQRDAQNPQGEEEEMKESLPELQMLLQNRQIHGGAGVQLDPELAELNKGGVAALNRQSLQQRNNMELEMHEMQAAAEIRANEKDMVLMQNGMLSSKKEGASSSVKPEEKKPKKATKLGPSSIRTLIRAAESRKD